MTKRNPEADRKAIRAVLAMLENNPPSLTSRRHNDTLHRSFEDFFSGFPPNFASELASWLKTNTRAENMHEHDTQIVLSGLTNMAGVEPVRALLNMVRHDNPQVAALGWRGLSNLAPERKLEETERRRFLACSKYRV